ncbi:MAG: MFS transporter [SAR202 cluster bacterium]|nr:MFS transporter [SAR202 cluster bacterium]
MNPDSGAMSGAHRVPESILQGTREMRGSDIEAAIPREERASRAPRPKSRWRQTFVSLSVPDFRRLWLGTVIMIAALQMQGIAQGYLVYEMTGSAKLLGLVGAGMALPLLILAPFGGAIADRVNQKRLIQGGQIATTLVAILITLAIATNSLHWQYLLVAGIVQGLVWSFMGPARQALLPRLVGHERADNAIALVSAGMSAPALIAPAIAGLLYAFVGPQGVYLTVSALGFVAVAMTTSIRHKPEPTDKPKRGVASDVKDGLQYVWSHETIRVLMGIVLVFVLLSAPLAGLLPVLVVDVYHREAGALGLLVSAMGIGSLIGTLFIAGFATRKRGLLLILSGLASGAALLLAGIVPVYFIAVGVLLVLGLGNAGQWSLNQILVMGQLDDRYRGRVMGIYMMTFGLAPLAVLPAGVAVDMVGPAPVLAVVGSSLLLFSVFVLVTQRRIRGLQ